MRKRTLATIVAVAGILILAGRTWLSWTEEVATFAGNERTQIRLVCVRQAYFTSTAQVRVSDLVPELETERWTLEASLDTWTDCRVFLQDVVSVEYTSSNLKLHFSKGAALSLPRYPWEERWGIAKRLRAGSLDGAGPEATRTQPGP